MERSREPVLESPNENPIEDKERSLKERFLNFQLEYVMRLREGKIPSPSKEIDIASKTFGQLLEEFTDLPRKIKDAYCSKTGKQLDSDINHQEFENVYNEISANMEAVYLQNPAGWILQVDSIIESSVSKLPESEQFTESLKTERLVAGIIKYDVGAGHYGLKEYGISEDDECIKIHIDSFFKEEDYQKGKDFSVALKDSLNMLAQEVSGKFPHAKAIITESWLLDTAMSKKVGFHIYPSNNEHSFVGITFWGQFVDKNGNVKEDKINKFLETGKPPHIIKSGYILMDEFLRKYLPK